MMPDIPFQNFESVLAQHIEEHLPGFTFGTDEANDRAWQIAREFAWRLWAEMGAAWMPLPPLPKEPQP